MDVNEGSLQVIDRYRKGDIGKLTLVLLYGTYLPVALVVVFVFHTISYISVTA